MTIKKLLPAGYKIEGSDWLFNRLDEVCEITNDEPSTLLGLYGNAPTNGRPLMLAVVEDNVVTFLTSSPIVLSMAELVKRLYPFSHKVAEQFYVPAGWVKMILEVRSLGYTIMSPSEVIAQFRP